MSGCEAMKWRHTQSYKKPLQHVSDTMGELPVVETLSDLVSIIKATNGYGRIPENHETRCGFCKPRAARQLASSPAGMVATSQRVYRYAPNHGQYERKHDAH
ncbi:hypothetical protein IG631_19595 [Alternaria alternata]|nr:hypothetical protein IG631_19595 [Alternaria alternata]